MRYHLIKLVSHVVLLSLQVLPDTAAARTMDWELPIAMNIPVKQKGAERMIYHFYKQDDNFENHAAINGSADVDVSEKSISTTANQQGEPVFTVVEQMPEFPGGVTAMHRYITAHVQEQASSQNTKVTFIVNTDGSIQDVTIVKSTCAKCDEALIKAINSMPKWRPGSQSGRKVRVRYVMSTQPNRR
jgi:protein TonB